MEPFREEAICLEGLPQFEKVLVEVSPVKEARGEITEVQVLEEGEIPEVQGGVFDPEEFLDQLQ